MWSSHDTKSFQSPGRKTTTAINASPMAIGPVGSRSSRGSEASIEEVVVMVVEKGQGEEGPAPAVRRSSGDADRGDDHELDEREALLVPALCDQAHHGSLLLGWSARDAADGVSADREAVAPCPRNGSHELGNADRGAVTRRRDGERTAGARRV